MENSKGLHRGREEREPTEQALCATTQPASLFFKISWKRMSHLNIAGNQIEVEGKNDFGQSFSLKCLHSNLCLEKKEKMPKFRREMGHSEQCWFSGGRALVCPGRGFYFDTHHNCLAACFPGSPLPACCRGGADRKAARLQQGLPAVCLQHGQGVLQQITALDNRTETHSLVSPRPASSESSSPTARIQLQKYKETWDGLGWWDTGPSALEQYASLSWDGPCVSTSQRTLISKVFSNQSSSGRLPDSLCTYSAPTWLGKLGRRGCGLLTLNLYYKALLFDRHQITPYLYEREKEEGMSPPCGES